MSNLQNWINRSDPNFYANDVRTLSWKFKQSIEATMDAFIADASANSVVVGEYDIDADPWRVTVLNDYRKYGLKLTTVKNVDNGLHTCSFNKIRTLGAR